jgi:hypothetical protein
MNNSLNKTIDAHVDYVIDKYITNATSLEQLAVVAKFDWDTFFKKIASDTFDTDY